MDQLLAFTELIRKFREVKRKITFSYRSEPENDAEHSYQLAVTAWYIASSKSLSLDLEKVFKYALAHDLVEAYAGDTPAVHPRYEAERKTKEAREEAAAKRIAEEFPEFGELHQIIHAYEERRDEEAKFVYALDKILPLLNIYPDGGYSWKEHGDSLEAIIADKKQKVAESLVIKEYFDVLAELMDKVD